MPQAAPAAQPKRSGEDIDDEVTGWCAEQTKPSSIVICADRDLRQMSLIRNKIFADARTIISPDAYKDLLADQSQWVKTYSASCGVAADGPEPPQPISSSIIDCYKREAFKRIADLVSRLGQTKAGYRPAALSTVQTGLVEQALRQRADAQKAEEERQRAAAAEQAERERRRLAEQAERERQERERQEARERERAKEEARRQSFADLKQKLTDSGYKMEKPVELEIDWRDLISAGQKVAVQGNYIESNDIELLLIENKDMPRIRLYTDRATREARILMLNCRNNNYRSSCDMIVAASVTTCVRNKGEINEKEVPCLNVEKAFANPMADQ